MKVLIADDHAVVRRGLKETIHESFPKTTFGEAKTAQEAIESVRRQDWDVVILDISMPGKSGLDILDDLKRLRPKVPVLFLSMHPEEQYAVNLLRAGASGYLMKDATPKQIVRAASKCNQTSHYQNIRMCLSLVIPPRFLKKASRYQGLRPWQCKRDAMWQRS